MNDRAVIILEYHFYLLLENETRGENISSSLAI